MGENIEELKAVLKKAEEGSIKDIRNIVTYYNLGRFCYPDSEKALYWLRKLYYADQNEYDNYSYFVPPDKIIFRSVKFLDGGKYTWETFSEQEQLKYIELFRDRADKGDQFYCIMMGEIMMRPTYIREYFNSEAAKKMYSIQNAIDYYKKAVDLGSSVACHKLGDILSGYNIDVSISTSREKKLTDLLDIKYEYYECQSMGWQFEFDRVNLEERIHNAEKRQDVFFNIDFELAKKYYELGAELGNDICKDRLKDYDKRVKKTQRLIARSIPEDPKTGELMEDEDIEALLDWFRNKFEAE